MLWQEYRIRGEGEQSTDLTLLLATLIRCPLAFPPCLLTPPQRQPLEQGHTTELLAWGKSPHWRLKQEGQLLPISQYSTLQRAVAKLGCLTVSFARALAPFQAILSGLIVW